MSERPAESLVHWSQLIERIELLEHRAELNESDVDEIVRDLKGDARRFGALLRVLSDVCVERGLIAREELERRVNAGLAQSKES